MITFITVSTIKSTGSGNHALPSSSEAPSSSSAPYYDYCSVPAATSNGAQPEDRVYATLNNDSRSPQRQKANGNDRNYYSIESNDRVAEYDYTVVYEDPTSPSYVVCGVYTMSCYWLYKELF